MHTVVAVMNRTTTDVRGDVLRALEADAALAGAAIEVSATDSGVRLTGSVDFYAQRLEAEEAAHRVLGVRDVTNELRVRESRYWGMRDFDIVREAQHALDWNRLFTANRIAAASMNGTLYLAGRVTTLFEKLEAERAVTRLPGVREIVNGIVVVAAKFKGDELAGAVRSALLPLLGAGASAVTVSVEGGSVTLDGTVSSWNDRAACVDAVSKVRGVAEIRDLLRPE